MPTTRRPTIPYMIPLFLALTALLCVAAWLLGIMVSRHVKLVISGLG